jgi:hypothetical protein
VTTTPRNFSLTTVRRLSSASKLNATGLVLTGAGMLIQVAAGSTLYPSFAGPIVLLASAVIVLFGPARWTPFVGLLVPLALGVGALIAALMTGDFVDQLTNVGEPGVLVGSVFHVIGLTAAVVGGVGMVQNRRTGA